jgi:hypothetical protein
MQALAARPERAAVTKRGWRRSPAIPGGDPPELKRTLYATAVTEWGHAKGRGFRRRICFASSTAALSPAFIDPEIAIAALLPMTGLPNRSLVGPLLVMAGKPSPLRAGPAPMTGLLLRAIVGHPV